MLQRAPASGDLLAARVAAGDLPHVGREESAALLALIASSDPEKLDAAAVRSEWLSQRPPAQRFYGR
jgi:hypothetical protein